MMNIQDIKKVGIVGAGTMGHGIAQVFAQSGYKVALISRRERTLTRALQNVKLNLTRLARQKLVRENAIEETLSRIEPSIVLEEAMSDVDFVVEAVPEVMDVKKDVFKSLDSTCLEHTILATNTSGLGITEIGSATQRPDKVVGTHFWFPSHLMPLVEIIKGALTSEETFQTTYELMEKVGKVPVKILKDIPGFIGNRIQHGMLREVFALLEEKVATIEDIDKVVKLTFGVRLPIIGPLMTADFNGLDVVLNVHSHLLKYIDRSTEPAGILREKVEKGDLGVKTGKGFYTWTEEKMKKVITKRDEELISLLRPYLHRQF